MKNLALKPGELLWPIAGGALVLLGFFRCFQLALGGFLDKLGIGLLFLLWVAVGALLLKKLGVSSKNLLFCLFSLGLAVVLRVRFLDAVTWDYSYYLANWVQFFRENGGFLGIKSSVGDYNVSYLYFLAFFSYLPVPDLYLIKFLSICADLAVALAGFRLARRVFGKETAGMAAFSVLLLLPTAIWNGAYWGQCDAIYGGLILLALADALEEHPARSVVLLAIAFSFKLQSVFLIPMWCVFWFTGQVKFKHLCLFPISYFGTILPALLLGKPLLDILSVYFGQAVEYNSWLTLNAPSVYSLISGVAQENVPLLAKLGVLAAFLFLAVLLFFLFLHRKTLTEGQLLTAALLMAVGIPFLLPHMHDRYYFLADVLSVVWACGNWKRAPAAVAVQIASLIAYYTYAILSTMLPQGVGACLLAVVAVDLAAYLYYCVRYQKDKLVLPMD